jgi:hypothetical protein
MLDRLQLVAHLPSDLPQRISGFAFDGEKLWAMIYQGQGRYATVNPNTWSWIESSDQSAHQKLRDVSGRFSAPGGIAFAGNRLWVGGSYGDSIGSIDLKSWSISKQFKGTQRQDYASQSYSSLAFDGENLWVAWHWFRYDIPASETQLLLKINPTDGSVLASYPLPPGNAADTTHGLTWDGNSLWHIKDHDLVAVDPNSGLILAHYKLPGIERAAGLATDGHRLWIAEFRGNIWELPFTDNQP